MYDWIKVGYSDYWDVWLKIMGDKIELKRMTALDYEYMEEYIDNNTDLLSEWQDDAYQWRTELGYDDRRQNYEYEYSDYFHYDGEVDIYYDENDNDCTWDYFYPTQWSKEEILDRVLRTFDDDYMAWNFEWAEWMNDNVFREKIWEYYDKCIKYEAEMEEKRKPHWSVFNYYK